jgi:isochorismate synthase
MTGNIILVLELNKEGFTKDTLKSDLYVNLRCEIRDSQAHLYMGCGITKIVIQEWNGRRASTNPC